MPTVNGYQLNATFEHLTKALKLQREPRWVQSTPKASVLRSAIENSVFEVISMMKPEANLMNKIIETGSERALSDLLSVHGDEVYHECDDLLDFSDAIETGNVAQLDILVKHGFDLVLDHIPMLRRAWNLESAEYLAFIRRSIAAHADFIDVIEIQDILVDCPDIFIDNIQDEINRRIIKRQNFPAYALGNATENLSNTPLKVIAVLLATGLKMSELLSTPIPPAETDPLARLMHLGGSTHGALALSKLEPSMRDILARRTNGVFYGISPKQAAALIGSW